MAEQHTLRRSPERVGTACAALPERAGEGRAGHVILAGHVRGGSGRGHLLADPVPPRRARTRRIVTAGTMRRYNDTPWTRSRPLFPQAAARYMRRRFGVRGRLVEEQRATSMDTRLHRPAGSMASAREMGWSDAHDAEDDALRKRWRAPRRATSGEA